MRIRSVWFFCVSSLVLGLGLVAQPNAQSVTYEYDSLKRVTTATYADGTLIRYEHDANGNRTLVAVTRPNAPGVVQIGSAEYHVAEGTPSLLISVARVSGTLGAASVSYATIEQSANANGDYTAVSGVLIWNDGDNTPKTFSVPITDDTNFEPVETFRIVLSNVSGATLGEPSSATVTITDDDAPAGTLQLSLPSQTVSEAVGSVLITVSRVGGNAGVASVDYTTGNETAIAGEDYLPASGTLTWANGDAADKTFNVEVIDDSQAEDSESFGLTLSHASGATLGVPSTASIAIADNDAASVPNTPAAIYPTYHFVVVKCAPRTICPDFSGGPGGVTQVTWDPPVGAAAVHHYELQQALNSANFTSNLVTVFSGSRTYWMPQGLVGANPANRYFYRVRACNSDNQCSSWREVSIWEVCKGLTCNPEM